MYILSNEAFATADGIPIYKIGITEGLEQRMRSLYATGVPLPFECEYAAHVPTAAAVEKAVFGMLHPFRVNENREFFRLKEEQLRGTIDLLKAIGTPVAGFETILPVETEADTAAIEKEKRRSAFRFSMVDLEPGAVLTFAKDPAATCKVHDDRNVEFEGEVVSLTVAAQRVLERLGYQWQAVQGPLYWLHAGRSLSELRRDQEALGE